MLKTLQEPAHLGEGDVLGTTAVLTDNVMVIGFLNQMHHSGTVPEVDVMEMAGLLEDIDRPIDRRLVHRLSQLLFDPGAEIGGGEVIEMGGSQHSADRSPRSRYPQPLVAQRSDQFITGDVHNERISGSGFCQFSAAVDHPT